MKTFLQLKKNLKQNFYGLKSMKVAVLGDSATQLLVQALKGVGFDSGWHLDVWEADFNQIERQVFDPSSELYEFKPDLVILFHSTHKLLNKFNKLKSEETAYFAEHHIQQLAQICDLLGRELGAKIICYNYPEIDDSVFGNYANRVEASFLYQIRKANFDLMNLAVQKPNLFVCDLCALQNRVGRNTMFQSSIYVNTDMVLSMDVLPEVAYRTVDIINALQGKFKKCLILDLDNTTWGGIIGDDGLENIQIGSLGIGKAFTELQYWAKKLKNRGVILAVCSKNTESVAKEPFEKHPDMVLRLDDIAVFVANWENKADNIRHIQAVLNIGFDSMVFLDDNPFERNLVRENIPAITVPELPEDPAEYLPFLYSLNLFETVSYSEADAERTKQYQIEAQRVSLQKTFVNEDDYLKSLNQICTVEPITKFNTPRIAQLSQRSNQFNLRTVRYSEAEIEAMGNDDSCISLAFSLEDKFGDNGLICVIIMKPEDKETLFIDTWFMSCRVLKRSMENFALNTIVEEAKQRNFKRIIGQYLPTTKNEMVKEHYKNLGFNSIEDKWEIMVGSFPIKTTFIAAKKILASN